MGKASAKKTGIVSGLDFISNPDKYPPAGVCAIFGDEEYVKREVLAALRQKVLPGEDAELALTIFNGKETQLREVVDALSTVSLFGSGPQLVILEEADPFVTLYRAELEDYVTRPAKRGVLVLDVKTWPGNTRLAKAVAVDGLTIECRSYESCKPQEKKPLEREIKAWLTARAKTVHKVRLETAATDALLELVPPELGILVQEIDKLALVVGPDRVINVKLVQENVGGWRTRATWDMVDAAADGRAADALVQLDRLMTSGEKPFALLPQMASSLRRFPTAVHLIEAAEKNRQRLPPREALAQAGVIPFKLGDAERQLRQIGRQRAKQLTQWLLAADLAMKGHNSSDERARMEIERLIIRLSAASSTATGRGNTGAARLAASTQS